MYETGKKKVDELMPGDQVDLLSCPTMRYRSVAHNEYGQVEKSQLQENGEVEVLYTRLGPVRYPAGYCLDILIDDGCPDFTAEVRLPGKGGQWSEWRITTDLTDRWGYINDFNAKSKPLAELDREQLKGLLAQMSEGDEITFIAKKDGQFGILYEVEYSSQESEQASISEGLGDSAGLQPHAKVIQSLLDGLAQLHPQFPGVQFAVPHESRIADCRPAVWAFVPDGLLNAEQRMSLGTALLYL